MQTDLPITEPDGWHQREAATWIVKRPVPKNDSNDDEGASECDDDENITLLPFDNDHIKVTVYDSILHGPCSEVLCANQAVSLRGRGRRVMRGGRRARGNGSTRSQGD